MMFLGIRTGLSITVAFGRRRSGNTSETYEISGTLASSATVIEWSDLGPRALVLERTERIEVYRR